MATILIIFLRINWRNFCPPPNLLIFASPPRISVTHFASPRVPLDAPAAKRSIIHSFYSVSLRVSAQTEKNASSFMPLDRIGRFLARWYTVRVTTKLSFSIFDLHPNSPRLAPNWRFIVLGERGDHVAYRLVPIAALLINASLVRERVMNLRSVSVRESCFRPSEQQNGRHKFVTSTFTSLLRCASRNQLLRHCGCRGCPNTPKI